MRPLLSAVAAVQNGSEHPSRAVVSGCTKAAWPPPEAPDGCAPVPEPRHRGTVQPTWHYLVDGLRWMQELGVDLGRWPILQPRCR